MRKQLIILAGVAALFPGCNSMKTPLSTSLYSPFVSDQTVVFKNVVGLRVEVPPQESILRKHPSGYVGSAVEFQFDMGNALTGLTRDALNDLFQDVAFVPGADGNVSKEKLDRFVTVTYSNLGLNFALSYASNKFDKASLSAQAHVVVKGSTGQNLFDKVLSLKGDYVHDAVGGDAGSLDRALSMAVSRMVTDLKNDVAFAGLFETAEATADAPAPAEGSIEDKLERLRALKEKGLITAEDYEKARAKVLGDLVGK